jgi:uncharacterized membrane protein YebE (DUF533 family)
MNRKLAISLAAIVGVGVVGYLAWWAYNKYRTSSADPVKNNRDIQITRG